ncbi:MAG: GGDEF domain-containing protein [Streptosporangiales bacterium]|nr:GGDEF domain-containing protein [Streptosporangiales bacterium]
MAETALRVPQRPRSPVRPAEAALAPRLAREWLAALDGGRSEAGPLSGILGHGPAERVVLTDIAARLVSILFGTTFEPGAAETAGRALVAAGFTGADVLGRSLRVLMLWLPSALEDAEAGCPDGDLARRLADVTGAFADGYARGLRDRAVAEQETLRRAELDAERLLSRQLRHQAMHDPLTGLPNRTAIFGRLAEALSSESAARVGLCYLDLDGFKGVNDTEGHAAGDKLLAVIAERFGRVARARGAVAARIGGDEFIVLAERSPGLDGMIILASALLAEARRPIALPAGVARVSACAGVVERTAGTTAESVVAAADAALYEAKSRGPGRWSAYAPARSSAAM